MAFGLGSYGFGLLAGLLSTLSPCVLPILPIVLASATAAHPRAPLALAGGLALSYAAIGTLIAWAGSAIGLDTSAFRSVGAALLGLLGLVLMSTSLQRRFASATSGMGNGGNHFISRLNLNGLSGQFAIGLASLSRAAMMKVRGKLMQAGKTGKIVLGAFMVAIALLILTGADRPLEAWLVDLSPAWLTALTTRF